MTFEYLTEERMEVVKSTKEYTIFKKRNGRYGVKKPNGSWINGEEKVKILLDQGLIKVAEPKAPEADESNEKGEASEETQA